MAFWNRRPQGYVYVYSYNPKTGKQQTLRRSITNKLDDLTDREIDEWVQKWSDENEKMRPRVEAKSHSAEVDRHITDWAHYLESRGLHRNTITGHVSRMNRFVAPFFTGLPLDDWPKRSIKLLAHLQELELGTRLIQQCNGALRKFYQWAGEEDIIRSGYEIKLRNPVFVKPPTPLKRIVFPTEVLEFAENADKPKHVRMFALLSYFLALRPQEVFAAMPQHFKAGMSVRELECSKTIGTLKPLDEKQAFDFFDRLVIYVHEQKDGSGKIDECKKGSNGWVNCFSERAARAVVQLLKEMPAGRRVGKYNNRRLYSDWKEHGIKDCTIKDMRRSSLYWLGHHTSIQPMQLQKFARHSDIKTTMIYMRRPEDKLKAQTGLELDC